MWRTQFISDVLSQSGVLLRTLPVQVRILRSTHKRINQRARIAIRQVIDVAIERVPTVCVIVGTIPGEGEHWLVPEDCAVTDQSDKDKEAQRLYPPHHRLAARKNNDRRRA